MRRPKDQIRLATDEPDHTSAPSNPRCAKCGVAISPAYHARAELPGICGHCVDRFRAVVQREARQATRRDLSKKPQTVNFIPRQARRRFVLGLLTGATVTVFTATLFPALFANLTTWALQGLAMLQATTKGVLQRLI